MERFETVAYDGFAMIEKKIEKSRQLLCIAKNARDYIIRRAHKIIPRCCRLATRVMVGVHGV